MRAVCYARVSSVAQRERDTIGAQLRVLPEYIARENWELVRPVTTYVDDGHTAKSGKLAERRGLAALLRDAALGVFDVVVVMDIDRLTRAEDLAERGLILGALQHAGVRVASALGGELMDLNSDHGDLLASLKAYVSASDNRKRSERVRQGKLSAAVRGGKTTGRTPFGLLYTKPNLWAHDPQRAPIVAEIYARAARRETMLTIASDLAARKLACPGAAWTKGRVHDILKSTTYIGDYIAHAATRTVVSVPPIVTVEIWQRAQDALVANRKVGLRRTRHTYLLEGLGVCACGAPMRIRSAFWKRGKVFRPAVYACSNRLQWLPMRARTEPSSCAAPFVITTDADARAWAAICQELEDARLPLELAAERRGLASDAHDWEADGRGYREHLSRLDKVEAALLVRFRRGAIGETALDGELAGLRKERAGVRVQLATAERARGATVSAQARLSEATVVLGGLRSRLATATPEERRDIAATMIDPGGVRFDGQQLRIELFVERPASTEQDRDTFVRAASCSDDHESYLRIRVVA